jgi:glycosyltransferase involved in cell wall biosynthesis
MNTQTSTDTPVVSVVIPCYNGRKYITGAIDSVLAQTAGPVEVVVVDDGSTDDSAAVVERYCGEKPVKLIRHGENRGIAAARNTGVRACRSRVIGFLDQDDLWREDKVELQLAAFAAAGGDDVGVVFANTRLLDENGSSRAVRPPRVPRHVDRFGPDDLIASLFRKNYVPIGSALIRRECFESVGFLDETIRSGSDDFEFLVRVASRYRFVHIALPLFVRRLHGANYTNVELMMPDAVKIIDRVTAERPSLKTAAVRARSRLLFSLARDLHWKRKYTRARRAYVDSIRTWPLNVRAHAGLLLCNLGRTGDFLFSVFRGSGQDQGGR